MTIFGKSSTFLHESIVFNASDKEELITNHSNLLSPYLIHLLEVYCTDVHVLDVRYMCPKRGEFVSTIQYEYDQKIRSILSLVRITCSFLFIEIEGLILCLPLRIWSRGVHLEFLHFSFQYSFAAFRKALSKSLWSTGVELISRGLEPASLAAKYAFSFPFIVYRSEMESKVAKYLFSRASVS